MFLKQRKKRCTFMDLGDMEKVEDFECAGLDARTALAASVVEFLLYNANRHVVLDKCQGRGEACRTCSDHEYGSRARCHSKRL